MRDIEKRMRDLERDGAFRLPPSGSGDTPRRHAALIEFARESVSLARLAEAHLDAIAILHESGHPVPAGQLYGVWASDGPQSTLDMSAVLGGGFRLDGVKRYCSGAGQLDRALVTAHSTAGLQLVDLSLDAPGLTIDGSAWVSPAFSETTTATVAFEDVRVEADATVGAPGWYLSRPGFWHGALGPAACWAGGAVGLVDAARAVIRSDPFSRAHLGALEAEGWAMRAVLEQAGTQVDADPEDRAGEAHRRALMVRYSIERACTRVLDQFGLATGPQLLAFDASIAQRYAEVALYIRQSHGDRDLAQIPSAPS